MKFGLLLHLPNTADRPEEEVFAEAFALLDVVKGSFDGVWATEHHFSNFGLLTAPLPFLVKAATLAPRLRVGPAVLVLPAWASPLRLAEEIATVDQLTEGRLDVGIGRGYQPHEFGGFGATREESRARFEEAHEILLRAFTQVDWTFEGRYYQVPEPVTVFPHPRQRPYPPMWVAAASPDTIGFAARYGYHLGQGALHLGSAGLRDNVARYHAELRRHGHDPALREVLCNRSVYCAPSDAEAEEALEWGYQSNKIARYMNSPEARIVRGRADDSAWPFPRDDQHLRATMVLGSPRRCIARLHELEEAGVTYVNCLFDLGAMPFEKTLRSAALFAQEVVPAFRQVRASTSAQPGLV